MKTILLSHCCLVSDGLAGLGEDMKQVLLQLLRSSLLSMEQSVVSTQENPRLIINSYHPTMPVFLFSFFFSCNWQSRQMTNTQNTARHSTTESKLYSTRIRDLLKKDIVWLNNYSALDVVDEDCYTLL